MSGARVRAWRESPAKRAVAKRNDNQQPRGVEKKSTSERKKLEGAAGEPTGRGDSPRELRKERNYPGISPPPPPPPPPTFGLSSSLFIATAAEGEPARFSWSPRKTHGILSGEEKGRNERNKNTAPPHSEQNTNEQNKRNSGERTALERVAPGLADRRRGLAASYVECVQNIRKSNNNKTRKETAGGGDAKRHQSGGSRAPVACPRGCVVPTIFLRRDAAQSSLATPQPRQKSTSSSPFLSLK